MQDLYLFVFMVARRRADKCLSERVSPKPLPHATKAVAHRHHTTNINTSIVHFIILNIQLNVRQFFFLGVRGQFSRFTVLAPLTKCHVNVC